MSTPRQSFVLSSILLGGLAMTGPISIDGFLPAMPSIAKDLGVSIGSVELSLTAIFAGNALGQILYGPLSDRYGRKSIALIAIFIFGVSSVGLSLSGSLGPIIFWRFIQGVCLASGRIIANAAARDQYEKERLGKLVSLIFIVSVSSSVFTPLIGGYVAETYNWQSVFVLMTAYAVIIFLALLFFFKETLVEKNLHAIRPMTLLTNFAQIARTREFIYNVLVGGFGVSAFIAFISASSGVAKSVFHFSPQTYSYYYAGSILVFLLTIILSSRLVERAGMQRLIKIGVVLQLAGGLAVLFLALSESTSPWSVFVPMAVYMMGFAFLYPLSVAAALSPFTTRAGAASSLLGFLQNMLGAAVSAALAIFIDGTALPMAWAIAFCTVGAALVYGIYLRTGSPTGTPRQPMP